MANVVNINDVLDEHVALEIECVDRLYLNAYLVGRHFEQIVVLDRPGTDVLRHGGIEVGAGHDLIAISSQRSRERLMGDGPRT